MPHAVSVGIEVQIPITGGLGYLKVGSDGPQLQNIN